MRVLQDLNHQAPWPGRRGTHRVCFLAQLAAMDAVAHIPAAGLDRYNLNSRYPVQEGGAQIIADEANSVRVEAKLYGGSKVLRQVQQQFSESSPTLPLLL